jgi:glucose/arabinose dehydrogenase
VLWDNDRLSVVHPPHLSACIDKDGDGVAEEEKRLVSDIAFGFADRPADHTTNGISMGVDGWLYIANTGAVVRVRLDGSGKATGEPETVAEYSSGGGHWTRTVIFGPDGAMYVAIGSSCNLCEERDARRAA